MILAMRSRFDPAAAGGLRATFELRLGDDGFRIEVAGDARRSTPIPARSPACSGAAYRRPALNARGS
jgi:hypothetical protein